MKYRKIDIDGDYTLGTTQDFLTDTPETVAQAVKTRLALWAGEWFLDTSDGTPWIDRILGKRFIGRNHDAVIRQRILETPGVVEISDYSSTINGETRSLSVAATITTTYGTTQISTVIG